MNNAIKALACASLSLSAVGAYAGDSTRLITHSAALAGNVTPGDAPGYPVTISRRGSYKLASNLRVTDIDTDAVQITIGNVSLDLNGWSILGPSNGGSGIGVRVTDQFHFNVTVRDGTIEGFGGHGMLVAHRSIIRNMHISRHGGLGVASHPESSSIMLTNSIVTGNFQGGVALRGRACTVTDSSISDNNFLGLAVGTSSIVRGNTIENTQGIGLIAGSGSLVSGNTARENFDLGFELAADAAYRENVLVNNAGGPSDPQVTGGIQIGTNLCGNDTTCP